MCICEYWAKRRKGKLNGITRREMASSELMPRGLKGDGIASGDRVVPGSPRVGRLPDQGNVKTFRPGVEALVVPL
jgi:hypothetical protein